MDTAAPLSPPASVEEFRERLSLRLDDMPKRLRQCAGIHCGQHRPDCRVDRGGTGGGGGCAALCPDAVFVRSWDFPAFRHAKAVPRGLCPGWPDYSTRLKNLREGGQGSPSALLAEFVEAGQSSLEALAKSVDEAALNGAVQVLAAADTVHLVGLRRAFPVASYLAYVFEKMQVPAMLHDGVGKLDHRFALRRGDALLAITFAPIPKKPSRWHRMPATGACLWWR